MAKNLSNKKTNKANNRPNCLKVTKKAQKVNLQPIKIINNKGKVEKVRVAPNLNKVVENGSISLNNVA